MKSFRYILARALARRPAAILNSKIDKTAKIGNGAQVVSCKIGKYTCLFDSTVVHAEIGAFCSIAKGCVIGGGKHPTDWVSSSPVFYRGSNVLKKNFSQNEFKEYEKTIIGNDVWIGSACLIKSGVKIGDGAIIGMGSVVTHDVPPYEIWAGNPAHLIRKRFDDETVARLQKLEWWNWDDQKLQTYGDLFSDPEKLLSAVEHEI